MQKKQVSKQINWSHGSFGDSLSQPQEPLSDISIIGSCFDNKQLQSALNKKTQINPSVNSSGSAKVNIFCQNNGLPLGQTLSNSELTETTNKLIQMNSLLKELVLHLDKQQTLTKEILGELSIDKTTEIEEAKKQIDALQKLVETQLQSSSQESGLAQNLQSEEIISNLKSEILVEVSTMLMPAVEKLEDSIAKQDLGLQKIEHELKTLHISQAVLHEQIAESRLQNFKRFSQIEKDLHSKISNSTKKLLTNIPELSESRLLEDEQVGQDFKPISYKRFSEKNFEKQNQPKSFLFPARIFFFAFLAVVFYVFLRSN